MRRKAKRNYIIEWSGFARVWRRSIDAPGFYTKASAMRIARRFQREVPELKYRARKRERGEKAHV